MAKKLTKTAAKKAAAPADVLDSQLASSVKASAQQIWLAGMGAFAKAQAEGGKMFEALVKEGVGLQRKTQAGAEDKLGNVTGKVGSIASDVASKAGTSWDKLENIFEERTAKALGKLGVPTSKEVAKLSRRIDELSAVVAALSKPAKVIGSKTPARTAGKKSVAKAPPKKSAAKPATKRAVRQKASAGPTSAA